MNGILPLWKPKGLTSHDCVMRIRRIFKMKKVGHTGTLDPDAEGVLPICLGEATKIVPFLVDTHKTYIAKVTLGASTETEDATGKVVQQKEIHSLPSHMTVQHVLNQFTGEITQVPPMYSAVKVNGKKLYEYARKGEYVNRPTRHVNINELELIDEDWQEPNSFGIKIICSKGTYIRTLCVDIGQALGYPAHMSALTRSQTGDFTKEMCVTLEELEKHSNKEQFLYPLLSGLTHLNAFEVDKEMSKKVSYGQKLPRPKDFKENIPYVLTYQKRLLAIYQTHPENEEEIKPIRVFNE